MDVNHNLIIIIIVMNIIIPQQQHAEPFTLPLTHYTLTHTFRTHTETVHSFSPTFIYSHPLTSSIRSDNGICTVLSKNSHTTLPITILRVEIDASSYGKDREYITLTFYSKKKSSLEGGMIFPTF